MYSDNLILPGIDNLTQTNNIINNLEGRIMTMQNLSTKEVNYLKDLMSWELLSAKKCFQFYNQETNESRKNLYYDSVSVHQQNFLSLLNYVDKTANQLGGQTH
jgi:hypothetical protein